MNAPKVVTWIISVILGALGVVVKLGLVAIPFVSGNAFWFVVAGLALLALGSAIPGL